MFARPCLFIFRRLIVPACLALSLAAAQAQVAPFTPPSTPPASAFAAGTHEGPVKLAAFSVTGSNVKHFDGENVLPVTVLNREAIEARNALTPIELLTALPQVTNVPLNESTPAATHARGDNANINLRGIGISSTLILLNGRRLAPHPMTAPDAAMLAFSVNVNQLPTQGIERIDVLRDGASSIYGTDAVAGVVNFITRRDLHGTTIRTRLALPEHGQGRNIETLPAVAVASSPSPPPCGVRRSRWATAISPAPPITRPRPPRPSMSPAASSMPAPPSAIGRPSVSAPALQPTISARSAARPRSPPPPPPARPIRNTTLISTPIRTSAAPSRRGKTGSTASSTI
ncbi:MAG: TonB-dependent receptor plug domain-containing protein [Verrucomicrobiota bacterium]